MSEAEQAAGMRIWVDADACPAVIKDILFRVADRLQLHVTLVANKLLRTPPSRFIHAIQVPAGFDVADNEIVRLAKEGDLVITGRYSAGRRRARKKYLCAQSTRRVLYA